MSSHTACVLLLDPLDSYQTFYYGEDFISLSPEGLIGFRWCLVVREGTTGGESSARSGPFPSRQPLLTSTNQPPVRSERWKHFIFSQIAKKSVPTAPVPGTQDDDVCHYLFLATSITFLRTLLRILTTHRAPSHPTACGPKPSPVPLSFCCQIGKRARTG